MEAIGYDFVDAVAKGDEAEVIKGDGIV